ncbi:thioesterase II family protein [Streptomyces sp. NPDC017940]|uniref:thioesterase II family protein n=1 Tax=Streptomyces sp. NPDC017940 TaxID=3365017 RepID=UPI0037AF762E
MSAGRASITPPYTNREPKREDALVGDWIRRFHPAPNAGIRLLCFPHAGGSASVYHTLSAAVAGNIEPLIVQHPGFQERLGEPFAERAEEVVAAVLAALPAPGDGTPTILFGHSMGALLAFETARRLAAEDERRPPCSSPVGAAPHSRSGPREGNQWARGPTPTSSPQCCRNGTVDSAPAPRQGPIARAPARFNQIDNRSDHRYGRGV